MEFWWVNHKQTFKREIEGGYIWSPCTNSNGSRNQTYLNLTLVKPGDIVFSYASTEIKAIGVVKSEFTSRDKPSDFGKAGDSWSDKGWEVAIDWQILSSPLRPKQHLDRIAPLLPQRNSPLQANGNGNQGCYLASISQNLGELLMKLIKIGDLDALASIDVSKVEIEENAIESEIENSSIETTQKEQIIKARVGQGIFRKNVELLENKCRVTGVKNKSLLIASHIKPWRWSTDSERLDCNNGLMLSPHIDKLFDQGWISFLPNGELLCANKAIEMVLFAWGIRRPINVGGFNPIQANYLRFHLENVYLGTTPENNAS